MAGRSQTWIEGFAFECQDREDCFTYGVKKFAANEAPERLEPIRF